MPIKCLHAQKIREILQPCASCESRVSAAEERLSPQRLPADHGSAAPGGWAVNHKRVARIRREDNLLCVPKLSFRPPPTDSRHGWRMWPNLARHPVPMAVNQLWVADITYIRMREEFVYLAVVLDAFSRRVVGWAMAEHLRAELALAALDMAIGSRNVTPGALVHHSDQGVQYACGEYIARLERAGIQPSMSRPGCPWDNAMAAYLETRGGERSGVSRSGCGGGFDRRVHRGGLQSATLAFGAGLSGATFEATQASLPCPTPASRVEAVMPAAVVGATL